ncbi:hypothetical protein [Sulfitobacter guttiformis]|uniref:Uncharacterized protein n=1 Tax=Sulfitobacter guttiformis TaxID=74349 RepID=A0A420DPJ7_9RHOB|nr:hypothetical protein [Sulfitobacter guttiformis]KIN73523.1 hypothetical protein Z949_2714 [Sulfitobacter guttiformis KCTC 32187]RKE96175.1 hypothetical protein C8N30_0728 [Sulfitobacter guttiformis]
MEMKKELDQLRFRIGGLEAILIASDKDLGEKLVRFFTHSQKTKGRPEHINEEATKAIAEIRAVMELMLPHNENVTPNREVQPSIKRQGTGKLSVVGAQPVLKD